MIQTIRRLKTEDVPAVMRIELSCFPIPWDEGTIIIIADWGGNAPSRSGRRVLFDVVESDGEILGYVVWETDPKTGNGHILNLAVDGPRQGQGIGTLLMQHAFRSLRDENHKSCWLEVREGNGRAQRLYERLGMKASGRSPRYYGNEDAIIYSARL